MAKLSHEEQIQILKGLNKKSIPISSKKLSHEEQLNHLRKLSSESESNDLIAPEEATMDLEGLGALGQTGVRELTKAAANTPEMIANFPHLVQKGMEINPKYTQGLPFVGPGSEVLHKQNIKAPEFKWDLGEKLVNKAEKLPYIGKAFEKPPESQSAFGRIGHKMVGLGANLIGSGGTAGVLSKIAMASKIPQTIGRAAPWLAKLAEPLEPLVVGAPKTAKELGQFGTTGLAGGATAGVLNELGVPNEYSDIAGLVTAPYAQSKAKQITNKVSDLGKKIFKPSEYTLEEAATHTGLVPGGEKIGATQSAIQEQKETLHEATSKIQEHKKRNLDQLIEDEFPHEKDTAQGQAGRSIRGVTEGNVEYLTKERRDVTGPMWDSLKTKDKIDIEPVINLSKEKYTAERGERKGVANKTEAMLKTSEPGPKFSVGKNGKKKKIDKSKALISRERIPTQEAEDIIHYFENNFQESAEDIKSLLLQAEKTNKAPTLAEVVNTRKVINKAMAQAGRSGNKSLVNSLNEFKQAIDQSVYHSVPPEVYHNYENVNKVYSEYSNRIADITKNRAMGKIAKREDWLSPNFKVGEEEIALQFLKGDKSQYNSERLKPYLNQNPEAKKDVQSLVNKLFVDEVMVDGVVNVKKLDAFKKKYKGAFNLYEGLETKLANTSNASKMYTDTVNNNKKLIKDFTKSKAHELLNENTQKVVDSIFSKSTKNPISDIKDIKTKLNADTTGAGWEGFQNSVTDNIKGKIGTPSFENMMTNQKNILGEIYNNDQIKALEIIHKKMSNPGMKLKGNDPLSKALNQLDPNKKKDIVLNHLIPKLFDLKIPFAGTLAKAAVKKLFVGSKQSPLGGIQDIASQILNNPDLAKLMNTPQVRDPKTLKLLEGIVNNIEKNSKYGPYMGWHKLNSEDEQS